MRLGSFSFLAAGLLAAASAAAAEEGPHVIAFPQSAGEAEFFGLAIVEEGGQCRVKEPTSPAADAFACEGGPKQRRTIDGQVFAESWNPPAFKGTYVPASRDLGKPKPPKLPGRVVSKGPDELKASLIQRLVISEKGKVLECAIESPSGDAKLDAAICGFDRARRFRPATLDGVRVAEVRYEIVKVRRQVIGTTGR